MTQKILEKKSFFESDSIGASNPSRKRQNDQHLSRPFIWLRRRACLADFPESGQFDFNGLTKSESNGKNQPFAFTIENKKKEVLESLKRVVEIQKKADREIRHILSSALSLGESGDGIADQIMGLIAELATMRNAETRVAQHQGKGTICIHAR